MASTLETLSWIAAIAAIPVAVIGWFFASSKEKINKSAASRGGVAISGDVLAHGCAGFVTGDNSPMNVNLTVGGDHNESYERRNAVFRATRNLLDEAPTRKFFSDDALNAFVTGVRDAPFLFHDIELIQYLNEIKAHATSLQAITITMEGPLLEHQRADASRAAGEHRLWLMAQGDDVLIEKFRPFLQQFDAKSLQPPIPNWSIRYLFFHIRPDLVDDPENREWEYVGRDVIDKFSTEQLKVWGRRIEDSKRLALAEIPAQEWHRAKFTYWFLKEHDGVSLDADCPRPSRGSAPAQYADLRVCGAQALTIWPRPFV